MFAFISCTLLFCIQMVNPWEDFPLKGMREWFAMCSIKLVNQWIVSTHMANTDSAGTNLVFSTRSYAWYTASPRRSHNDDNWVVVSFPKKALYLRELASIKAISALVCAMTWWVNLPIRQKLGLLRLLGQFLKINNTQLAWMSMSFFPYITISFTKRLGL